MTYYRRADETQRQDPELRAAVAAELKNQFRILKEASLKLQEALDLLMTAADIEEDTLGQSSGLLEARTSTRAAINRFNYKIDSPPTETFIGNTAAFMPPAKAEELKEKHRRE